MEENISNSQRNSSWPHIFGVRHLSPGGAWHLKQFLNEIKPAVVLIEGPSDANSQIEYLTCEGTVPPIAILAYTEDLPIRTILYPMAAYSPEYVALLWAKENNAQAQFIDLPSEVFLRFENNEEENEEEETEGDNISLYDAWTKHAGEEHFDNYWERNFEHNLNKDSYREAIYAFSKGLRELSEARESRREKRRYAENLVREAFMRRQIQKLLHEGHQAEKIVVITGAYHSSALNCSLSPMTEEDFENLPRRKSKLTLMPYSYFKLSTQSGYGAGNKAPAYYELMWQYLLKNNLQSLPGVYLSKVVENLRQKGTYRSTADVIEAVRLANTLAALKGGSAPTLKDLRDAATTCIGYGEFSVIAEGAARVEVGTAIGNLPEGVSRTPIQDDFYRELKLLKLDKYKTAAAQPLDLDLRENRRVKSEEAAFLDLHRSFFLHRLAILGIGFAKEGKYGQSSGNWAERWVLQWSPEAEIQMVESTLKGETIELATAFVFNEQLENSKSIAEVAKLIRKACQCGMMESMEAAKKVLQAMAVDSGDFTELAAAAYELSIVVSYGDIRKFSPEPLVPVLSQLFLREALMLLDASSCNNEAAAKLLEGMEYMNIIASEQYKHVDYELWYKKLMELSDRDDKNSKLSGYACGVLVEKNIINNEKLAAEVSRRLSPGAEADLGAGWFEGLSMRNRYALLSRQILWSQLEEYISSLDEEEFRRALVFMRRAFGSFTSSEKNRIGEILGDIWGANIEETNDLLSSPLSSEEAQVLDDLNDFDFGDI